MQIITAAPKASTLFPPALSAVLPPQLTEAVRRLGLARAEEVRLHAGRTCTVTCEGRNYRTDLVLSEDDLQRLLQTMCGGSLYAYAESICRGYLPLPGGVRVGIAGKAAVENGRVIGVSSVTGLILRIPNRITVDAASILSLLDDRLSGILLYASPGVGKTTLLRALARQASSVGGRRTVVVDSREELAETLSGEELMLDILVGYPRKIGIEIAVRTLGAELILCDEIGDESDAEAILSAANCGVPLIATAHAASLSALLSRPAFERLHRAGVFGSYVGLRRVGGNLQYQIDRHPQAAGRYAEEA